MMNLEIVWTTKIHPPISPYKVFDQHRIEKSYGLMCFFMKAR